MGTGRCPRNIEWLRQPLGFESLALSGHSMYLFCLASWTTELSLESFRGHRPVKLAPTDHRGCSIFGPTFPLVATCWLPLDKREGWDLFKLEVSQNRFLNFAQNSS